MKINEQAPVVGRKELIIDAPPEAIWEALSDVDAWPEWHPEIDSASLQGPFDVGGSFAWRAGMARINSELAGVDPGRSVTWTGKAMGARAVHRFELTPAETGTRVSTEESMEGFVARLLRPMLQRQLDSSLEAWLQGLEQRAQSADRKAPVPA